MVAYGIKSLQKHFVLLDNDKDKQIGKYNFQSEKWQYKSYTI